MKHRIPILVALHRSELKKQSQRLSEKPHLYRLGIMVDSQVWNWVLVTCFVCIGADRIGTKTPRQWTEEIELERLKTYTNQKTGAEAEYAFLTMDWGIVNYDREQAYMVADQLINYEQLVQGNAYRKLFYCPIRNTEKNI